MQTVHLFNKVPDWLNLHLLRKLRPMNSVSRSHKSAMMVPVTATAGNLSDSNQVWDVKASHQVEEIELLCIDRHG
ncbi:hypothetical protein RRG08_030259 [Elysia crispata]|uniref:Uncharacterized protein n=1 Tax=Elysia crispata TaxID=231223 RepID=A0AAE1AJD4_9GAST|nr:hypothetical protein RRG08_030259 [Elysia crispata]